MYCRPTVTPSVVKRHTGHELVVGTSLQEVKVAHGPSTSSDVGHSTTYDNASQPPTTSEIILSSDEGDINHQDLDQGVPQEAPKHAPTSNDSFDETSDYPTAKTTPDTGGGESEVSTACCFSQTACNHMRWLELFFSLQAPCPFLLNTWSEDCLTTAGLLFIFFVNVYTSIRQ